MLLGQARFVITPEGGGFNEPQIEGGMENNARGTNRSQPRFGFLQVN
jgi:hypothetical protein